MDVRIKKLGHINTLFRKCGSLCYRLKLNAIGAIFDLFRQKIVLCYFEKKGYGNNKFLNEDIKGCKILKKDFNVFVMWFQGENNMPEIIHECYNSILCNIKEYKVVLLTESNFESFIQLPDFIIKKYKDGIISRTHLSDIIRTGLLAQYGGLWIDSSVYLFSSLQDVYYNSLFICPNGTTDLLKKGWKYLYEDSNGWNEWMMATNEKGSGIFKYLYNALIDYWERENILIDYFIFDFFIYKFFKNNKYFHEYIRNLPLNNCRCNDLLYLLNKKCTQKRLKKFYDNSDTVLYKLSYKKQIKNQNGTFYDFLVKGKLQK